MVDVLRGRANHFKFAAVAVPLHCGLGRLAAWFEGGGILRVFPFVHKTSSEALRVPHTLALFLSL